MIQNSYANKCIVLNVSDATEGTEFDTLEFSMKVKCTINKSQPKDSFRAEDLYENHSSKLSSIP